MSSDRKTRQRPRERLGQGWQQQRKQFVRRRKEMRKWWKGRRRSVQQQRKTLRSWQKRRRTWRRTFWLVVLARITRTEDARDRLLRARFEPELEELGRRLPWSLLVRRPAGRNAPR